MEQLGKFQIQKTLGKGASATVYLARDTFSGQEVALKVLDADVVSGPEANKSRLKQFMNEASLAGQLTHPHIAAILEAAVDKDSGGYIAVEYVPGGDLSQFTSSGHLLPVGDAIEIAFKCCGALDYAFRQGIVHRDIKPANIMVVDGTNIKVADFGAAYLHRAQHTQIVDIGSPLYMSPEQIASRTLDHHSDMFALGVVLYELFTGQRPFVAKSMTELFRKILREEPVAPSALRDGLGSEVDRILLQMLRKAPEERYPGWAELALDLADIGHLSVYQQAIPDREKFVTLRRIAVLERLSDAEIWELAHAGRWKRIPAHTEIVREGEPGTSLFFLGSGEAKVTKQGRLLSVLHAGEYFGEMAYIKAGELPRHASAESITDVLLAEFETAALQQLSTNCRLQLTFSLLHTLVDRLSLADERMTRALT
ncbi:MAG TPA: serine/threonine-protein kinase [Burkholderiales bacterium]|nr:serine/threonine-protein kinase [Burkholderiales bacterium]